MMCLECFAAPVFVKSRGFCGPCYRKWYKRVGGRLVAKGVNTGPVRSGAVPRSRKSYLVAEADRKIGRTVRRLGCVWCRQVFDVTVYQIRDIREGRQTGPHRDCPDKPRAWWGQSSPLLSACCLVHGCRTQFRASGRVTCGNHTRSEYQSWRYLHSTVHRDNVFRAVHRRRAKAVDQYVEDVNLSYLIDRDKGICQLCGSPVLQYVVGQRHPYSASIDHVIPVSLKGEQSRANAQLTHLRCNMSKGNKGGYDEQLRLATDAPDRLFALPPGGTS